MASSVTFRIKIEGSSEVKSVTVDAQELGQAFGAVQDSVNGVRNSLMALSSVGQIADAASNALSQLQGALMGLTSAYAAQAAAETRLATAMRNTMGASDEEIQSIKDLADAQEREGIVSAGVQLAAAQELATYLEFSDSLKTIIPVLNDMIAQQLGLGASAESATIIATMLGKVMNGQTEALSRYGYKFDEAQKYILKYGDESERAAVLAEVVEQSVAGMNEALAKTPTGRMQQLSNSIGAVKDRIGQAVQGAMPFITVLAEISLATSGIVKLGAAFKTLGQTQLIAKAHTLGLAAAERLQAAAARVLGVSTVAAKTATGALKVEIIATEAAITLGLSLAISALVELLSRLIGKSKESRRAIAETDDAMDSYRQAAAEARAETAADIVELEDLIKSKGNEGDKVEELNRKYGNALGTYSTAAQWYDTLITKSKDYCLQLGYEAMAAKYKDQLAEAMIKQAEAQEKLDNTQRFETRLVRGEITGTDAQGFPVYGNMHFEQTETKEWKSAQAELTEANNAVESLTSSMQKASSMAADLWVSLQGGSGSGSSQPNWEQMGLSDLEKAIQEQKALAETLVGQTGKEAEAKAATDLLKRMEQREVTLRSQYGLGTSSSSGESSDMVNLTSDIEKYRQSVENAVAVNRTFGDGVDETQARLQAMRSGIISLIRVYGDEDERIQNLIKEYAALRSERRGDLMGGKLEALPAITGSVEVGGGGKNLSGGAALADDIEKYRRSVENAVAVNRTFGDGTDETQARLQAMRSGIISLIGTYGVQDDRIKELIEEYNKLSDTNGLIENSEGTSKRITNITSALGELSVAFGNLSSQLDGNIGQWAQWISTVLGAIGKAIPAILSLIPAKKADANANAEEAATGAASSVASVPYIGPVMAVAAVASIIASFAAIPKFVSGAVAYGPTLGLFGEYPGAASNPEIVAPLDKLRGLIGGGQGGSVRFRIDGRTLVGILEKERRLSSRT